MARAMVPTAQDGLTTAARTRRSQRVSRLSRERLLEHCCEQLGALRRSASGGPGGWRGLPYERLPEKVFELMTSGETERVAFQR